MTQILQFKRTRKTGKAAYMAAFFGLLTDCGCKECMQYRDSLLNDKDALENFMMDK